MQKKFYSHNHFGYTMAELNTLQQHLATYLLNIDYTEKPDYAKRN